MAVNIASRDTRVLKSFVEEIFEIAGRRGTLEFGTLYRQRRVHCPYGPTSAAWSHDGRIKERIRSDAVSRK